MSNLIRRTSYIQLQGHKSFFLSHIIWKYAVKDSIWVYEYIHASTHLWMWTVCAGIWFLAICIIRLARIHSEVCWSPETDVMTKWIRWEATSLSKHRSNTESWTGNAFQLHGHAQPTGDNRTISNKQTKVRSSVLSKCPSLKEGEIESL